MPQVVLTDQDGAQHLPGDEEMPQIRPRESPRAGSTVATVLEDPVILLETSISELNSTIPREDPGISTISGGQDTVEHVDASPHSGHKILFIAHPHQVSGLVLWKKRCRMGHDPVDFLRRLSSRHPADGVPGQLDARDGGS